MNYDSEEEDSYELPYEGECDQGETFRMYSFSEEEGVGTWSDTEEDYGDIPCPVKIDHEPPDYYTQGDTSHQSCYGEEEKSWDEETDSEFSFEYEPEHEEETNNYEGYEEQEDHEDRPWYEDSTSLADFSEGIKEEPMEPEALDEEFNHGEEPWNQEAEDNFDVESEIKEEEPEPQYISFSGHGQGPEAYIRWKRDMDNDMLKLIPRATLSN